MSAAESTPAFIAASGASITAENGPQKVECAPHPLGSKETGGSNEGVPACIRRQVRIRNAAGAGILDPARIVVLRGALIRRRIL